MQTAEIAGTENRQDPELLKEHVQRAWNHEARVINYVGKVALKEFGDGPCREAWREMLSSILPTGRSLRILDVGSGPGVFAQVCAELGHDVTGCDFSQRMIQTAEGLAAGRGIACRFVLGDAEAPPFPPQSFDVVLSRRLLFNLPRPDRAFSSWRNLVVPGGLVLSMDSDPSEMASWLAGTRKMAGRILAKVSGYQEAPQPYHLDPSQYQIPAEEFPLRPSPSHKVRVFMENAGLVDIRLIYTEKIRRIRRSMEPVVERLLKPNSQPYILIGSRAKD